VSADTHISTSTHSSVYVYGDRKVESPPHPMPDENFGLIYVPLSE